MGSVRVLSNGGGLDGRRGVPSWWWNVGRRSAAPAAAGASGASMVLPVKRRAVVERIRANGGRAKESGGDMERAPELVDVRDGGGAAAAAAAAAAATQEEEEHVGAWPREHDTSEGREEKKKEFARGANAPKGIVLSSGVKKVLRPLANLKLAIAELSAVAALSSVGTVIEQNKPASFYVENYPEEGRKVLGFVTSKLIFALQLDHIYSANYFLMLLALLAGSLVACTATTQWPMVKVAQRWRFRNNAAAYENLNVAKQVSQARIEDFGEALVKQGYQIFLKDGALYAFKGLGGKLAPIGVHASMLLALGGIVIGILGGFSGSAMIPEGSSATFSSLLRPASMVALPPQGSSSSVRVDDFRIAYRSDGSIQQFYTDVAVENEKGETVMTKTISVNQPLRYGGITAYQTDWSMAALSVKAALSSSANMEEVGSITLPMASLEGQPGVSGKLYAAFLPIAGSQDNAVPKGISFLAKDLESVVVYDSKGAFVGVRRPTSKKPITADGVEIVIDGIVSSSGLELKADPGVPLVYAGFGGMCITTVLSYLSHSQIWGVQKNERLIVGGKTNRAAVAFEVELEKLVEALPEREAS